MTTFIQDLHAMGRSELHEFIIELGEQASRVKQRTDVYGYGIVMAHKTLAKWAFLKKPCCVYRKVRVKSL